MFDLGKCTCNSSFCSVCISATATKPMTILRTVAYFEFDFLRILHLRNENSYETNIMLKYVHKNDNYFLMFFLLLLSLEKLVMHAISFRLSEAELSMHLVP